MTKKDPKLRYARVKSLIFNIHHTLSIIYQILMQNINLKNDF